MKLFGYGVLTSFGILGLCAHFLSQYQYELFFGWLGNQIDKYFSIEPYGLVFGLLLGGWFSLYEVWKRIFFK